MGFQWRAVRKARRQRKEKRRTVQLDTNTVDAETPSKKRRVRVEKDAMDIDNYEDSSSRSSSESDIVIDV